jgi:hypothetical protein
LELVSDERKGRLNLIVILVLAALVGIAIAIGRSFISYGVYPVLAYGIGGAEIGVSWYLFVLIGDYFERRLRKTKSRR